jgi:hypothetical protein
VQPSLILYTRSPTPATILVAACHAAPAHHETNKHDSPNEQRIKTKQPNHPRFGFKPRQVNDSSQSNQETDCLVSQCFNPALSHLANQILNKNKGNSTYFVFKPLNPSQKIPN